MLSRCSAVELNAVLWQSDNQSELFYLFFHEVLAHDIISWVDCGGRPYGLLL
jgi:hypothetical protein